MTKAARLEVRGPRVDSFPTRDGTRLVADIWEPETGGPYPVLLMRQCYGRKIGTSLCYASPAWYASHGYIVVMQDVRGRGDSEGIFAAFEHEAQDGADSVAWAARLANANGRVGMFGFSYQGTNQLLAASEPCPALRAIAPAMIGWDLRTDWAYENGAFPLRANLGWATQLAAENARRAGDHAAQAELFAASRDLPVSGPRPGRPDFMTRLGRYAHYDDWADRPAEDARWRAISPAAHLETIAANRPAVLLVGGWYDSHLPGTLAAYRALRGRMPLQLVVGPWAHFPWDRRVGELDFGDAAISDIDRLLIDWFDRWLATEPEPGPETTLKLFDMGACRWTAPADLAEGVVALWLAGSGRAAIDMRDGTLNAAPADAASDEFLVHDPWRPPAPCGGSFGLPPGPVNRHATDQRSDVLTFTTAPFQDDQLLSGSICLQLRAECDARSFDLHATLSRVTRAGAAYPLAEGYGTFVPGVAPVSLPMRASCVTLRSGERLRLSVAAACFPAFAVNPGTGLRPWDASLSDLAVMTLRIRTGALSRSCLLLPLLTLPPQDIPQ